MGKVAIAVYDPPEKGMPFLAVRIWGVKTKYKKVEAVAAKTRADAERIAGEFESDLRKPVKSGDDHLLEHYRKAAKANS